MRILKIFIFLITLILPVKGISAPVISNISVSQIEGSRLVYISYDLISPGFLSLRVSLQVSKDSGNTWTVPVLRTSGAIGKAVMPGYRKNIIWDAVSDNPGEINTKMRFRIIADDEFSLIPSGSVTLGTTSGDIVQQDPNVSISTSEYYIHQTEITQFKWDNVRNWALKNGYTDMPAITTNSENHPVAGAGISLQTTAQWCNASSEKEGLDPVYTKNGTVMRTLSAGYDAINWNANGYRLPTEAEWEKAARGGVVNKRYPWGSDNISHNEANYFGSIFVGFGDMSNGLHPKYNGYSPVGEFAPNAFGLYDMAGNAAELCYSLGNYSYLSSGVNNPRPSSVIYGTRRGGSYDNVGYYCTCTFRGGYGNSGFGFRPVRSTISVKSPPALGSATATNVKQHSVTLVANVTNNGGAKFIERGFVFTSDAANNLFIDYPGTEKKLADTFKETGFQSFTSQVVNLKPNTTYSVKSYAINHQGVTYSPVYQFTTLPTYILIPSGGFSMGRVLSDTDPDAPQVAVYLSDYFIQYTETTKEEWDEVRNWAISKGYLDLASGEGKQPNHPVHSITWHDVVKWCNAKSEKEGLKPVYSVSSEIMRVGVYVPDPDWTANGYRLPTEAEWEKAARGGLVNNRFPYDNVISHDTANYNATSSHWYDYSQLRGFHPTYATDPMPFTSPVRSFAPNGYNLFDMTGNVGELCWDYYEWTYYTSQDNNRYNPTGPTSGSGNFVVRGGSWASSAFHHRCSYRSSIGIFQSSEGLGFRTVRSTITN